ncbi:uncharacterized protein LOC118800139 [Colossoma macropomum]|uniref:uncharacterized protein LOC118800139 n=1 Tax=Colossoma macropomum TaxID=42526 RepID=UPI0018647293|nr:uncharacterized protein LOC118800139 [Colossoma macropomum]
MTKVLFVFLTQLLFGTFRLCILQRTSSDLRPVHPGEDIALHCDITADEMSWYQQSSEEMKLLVSAGKGKLNKLFFLNHNVDEGHYDTTENTSSVSLVIIGVNETDLGLYYCGGRNGSDPVHFGKAIRLNFPDDGIPEFDVPVNVSERSRLSAGCGLSWIMIITLMCVCMFCVLMNIICICVFCSRTQEKSTSCSCCSDTRDTTEEEDLQYTSLRHEAEPTASTARTPASASERVTYAKVSVQASKHLPA